MPLLIPGQFLPDGILLQAQVQLQAAISAGLHGSPGNELRRNITLRDEDPGGFVDGVKDPVKN